MDLTQEIADAIVQHLESMCNPPCTIKILSHETVEDNALYVVFSFDEYEQVAIYYPQEDLLFTPTDWQSGRIVSIDEIEDESWMDSAGDEAIVMNGLPRVFTALRDDARKEFGRKVRAAREDKDLSQSELAKHSGLKQANISRIESGRYAVTLDTITRLSTVLGNLI